MPPMPEPTATPTVSALLPRISSPASRTASWAADDRELGEAVHSPGLFGLDVVGGLEVLDFTGDSHLQI